MAYLVNLIIKLMQAAIESNGPAPGTSTRVAKIIKAPRLAVYQACLNPEAIVLWRVPNHMKGRVHVFDAREGGRFRMSLTYLDPQHSTGSKTSADTDTFQGRFLELIPCEKIIEIIEFESEDPAFAGDMKTTTSFTDSGGATEIIIFCEDIPAGIRPEDNEMGCKESLQKLALLLE